MSCRHWSIGALVGALLCGCSFDLSLPDRLLVDRGGDRGDGPADSVGGDRALDARSTERGRDAVLRDWPADHAAERPRDGKPPGDKRKDYPPPQEKGPPDQAPSDLKSLVACSINPTSCSTGPLVGGGVVCTQGWVLRASGPDTGPSWKGTCNYTSPSEVYTCCAVSGTWIDIPAYKSGTNTQAVTVTCPSASGQVLGGACKCPGSSITGSYPTTDNTWTCSCSALDSIEAWAYCLGGTDAGTAPADIVTPPTSGPSLQCAAGTVLVGGGCEATSGTVAASRPNGNGWFCAAGGGGTVKAYPRCAK